MQIEVILTPHFLVEFGTTCDFKSAFRVSIKRIIQQNCKQKFVYALR